MTCTLPEGGGCPVGQECNDSCPYAVGESTERTKRHCRHCEREAIGGEARCMVHALLDRVDEARDLLVGAEKLAHALDAETREDELAQMRALARELAEALVEVERLWPEMGVSNRGAWSDHGLLCDSPRGIGSCNCGIAEGTEMLRLARTVLAHAREAGVLS